MLYHVYTESKHFKVCYHENSETFADLGRFTILTSTDSVVAILRPKEFLLLIDNVYHAYKKNFQCEDLVKNPGSTIWSVSITKHPLDTKENCNIVLSLVIEEGDQRTKRKAQVYLSDLLSDDKERVKIEKRDIKKLKAILKKSLANWYRKNFDASVPHPLEHSDCGAVKENCELCSKRIWKFKEGPCVCLHDNCDGDIWSYRSWGYDWSSDSD